MSAPPFETATLEDMELLQCLPFREAGVPHGFTLRIPTVGAREKLSRALQLREIATMHQIHGNDVRVLEGSETPRCDGLLTNRRGIGVTVQSADCVPLLFWSPSTKAVAAVHAGWRGTLARIASRVVSRMSEVYGASAEDMQVAIGPAIRVCCYEVGDEVISAFRESGRDIDRISRPGLRGRRHLDLVEDNRAQLLASGVTAERIYDSGHCTYCENELFYSFRKEGSDVGRIFGVIGLPGTTGEVQK